MQAPVTASELPAASRRRTFSSEHFRRRVLTSSGADSDGDQAQLHAQDPHPTGSCMHDDAWPGEAAVGPRGVVGASDGGVPDAGVATCVPKKA